MNIREIRSFLAIAEYRSITLAAKRLHISQSALSKRLSRLEKELDTQLLILDGVKTRFTEEGKTFIPFMRQMLQAYEGMIENKNNFAKKIEIPISIASSVYLSKYIIHDVISYIKKLGLPFNFTSKTIGENEITTYLTQRIVDLIICPTHDHIPRSISSGHLWKEKLNVVVGKNHPLAQSNKPITLAKLTQYDAVVLGRGGYIREQMESLFATRHLPLRIAFEATIIDTTKEIVSSGLGWCLLYERLCSDQLKIINIEDATFQVNFSWYCLNKRLDEKPLKELIDHLIKWPLSSELITSYSTASST